MYLQIRRNRLVFKSILCVYYTHYDSLFILEQIILKFDCCAYVLHVVFFLVLFAQFSVYNKKDKNRKKTFYLNRNDYYYYYYRSNWRFGYLSQRSHVDVYSIFVEILHNIYIASAVHVYTLLNE